MLPHNKSACTISLPAVKLLPPIRRLSFFLIILIEANDDDNYDGDEVEDDDDALAVSSLIHV